MAPEQAQPVVSTNAHELKGQETVKPVARWLASNRQNLILTLLLIYVCVMGTTNKVFFTLMVTTMREYTFFCNEVNTLLYIPMFGLFSLWTRSQHKGGRFPASITRFPKTSFALIGILDMMGMTSRFFSARNLQGPMIVLLAQASIPCTMVMSVIFLKATYAPRQYVGVCILMMGIVVAILPKMMTQGPGSGDRVWITLYLASSIPSAISSVFRERIFRDDRVKMDAFYMGFWCSVCNVTLGLPMILFSGIPLNGILPNFQAGARCWFLGEGGPLCPKAFWRMTIYLVANISYNMSLVFVLKWGSAALMVIAGAVIMPLSNVVFTMPSVMGEQATTMKPTDLIALVFVVYGMTLFKVSMPRAFMDRLYWFNQNVCCCISSLPWFHWCLPSAPKLSRKLSEAHGAHAHGQGHGQGEVARARATAHTPLLLQNKAQSPALSPLIHIATGAVRQGTSVVSMPALSLGLAQGNQTYEPSGSPWQPSSYDRDRKSSSSGTAAGSHPTPDSGLGLGGAGPGSMGPSSRATALSATASYGTMRGSDQDTEAQHATDHDRGRAEASGDDDDDDDDDSDDDADAEDLEDAALLSGSGSAAVAMHSRAAKVRARRERDLILSLSPPPGAR